MVSPTHEVWKSGLTYVRLCLTLWNDCKFPQQSPAALLGQGDAAGIRPDWRPKVRLILSRLDVATNPSAMNSPGLGFHALTGDLKGRYAVIVSRNWRITFSWNDEDAEEIDLEDYHG